MQKIWQRIEIAIKKFRTGVPFRKAAEMAGLDYWDYQSELDKREVPVLSSLSLARARIKKHIKGQVSTPSEANLHGVNILHSSYQAIKLAPLPIFLSAHKLTSRQAGFYKRKVEVNPKNAFVDRHICRKTFTNRNLALNAIYLLCIKTNRSIR